MFSLTPIEAAIWQAGVAAQSSIATHVFGSVIFTGFIMIFFIKYALKVLKSSEEGADAVDVTRAIGAYGFSVAVGLTFLHAMSATPFKPQDAGGRDWGSYGFVQSSNKYESLRESHNGLHWYTLIHGAGNELSRFLAKVVGMTFRDNTYLMAPDMMFKLLVNTASMQLDNPELTANLDRLMQDCGDPQKGTVMGPGSGVGSLLDLDRPDCLSKYGEMQSSLKQWASAKIPAYVKKVTDMPAAELPYNVRGFSNRDVLENKMIGSALVSFAKDKARGMKDGINTNTDALNITKTSDHFWYLLQKAASGGGIASMVANLFDESGDGESAINRNEARSLYNNLLNLIPAFKGLVKAFIAIGFLAAAAGLCLGFSQPMVWWLGVVAMDMIYEPLSTLNYEISALLLKSSEIGTAFGELSHDPLAVMGAAIIDSKLVQYQTAYFLSQFAIAAVFVVGIIGSGFAVNKMSFSQGAGFVSLAGWVSNNRVLSSVGRSAGNTVNKVFGRR
jgi:hypothetical protein